MLYNIYNFLIFLLKANPPPVLVNTDSLDTPTYVSIHFLSITISYNASSLDLLLLISDAYFTLQYVDLLTLLKSLKSCFTKNNNNNKNTQKQSV